MEQPTINIGTLGSVSNGKTSVIKAITGISTIRHKKEKERNITIKLGYTNGKIFKCLTCPLPICYQSTDSSITDHICDVCGQATELKKHVSFIDCPGHESLIHTLINGSTVMDAAILIIDISKPGICQFDMEHLAAANIAMIKNIIVVLNKVDLVTKEIGMKRVAEVRKALIGSVAENAPIIPIIAQAKINIDVVIQYICEKFKEIPKHTDNPLKMIVLRSFDINKPGTIPENMSGGVAGGTLLRGSLKPGDVIEIRPGLIKQDQDSKFVCEPILATVTSLNSDNQHLQNAVPGGLIGLGSTIDPFLTVGDRLVGHVIGEIGKMPEILTEVILEVTLFDPKNVTIEKKDHLIINVNATNVKSSVTRIRYLTEDKGKMYCLLKLIDRPICADIGEKATVTKKVDGRSKIIGVGIIHKE